MAHTVKLTAIPPEEVDRQNMMVLDGTNNPDPLPQGADDSQHVCASCNNTLLVGAAPPAGVAIALRCHCGTYSQISG